MPDITLEDECDPMVNGYDELFKSGAQNPAEEGHQRLKSSEICGDDQGILDIHLSIFVCTFALYLRCAAEVFDRQNPTR